MGAFQLPDSVLADASGCLIYSFVCLIANCLLIWLTWVHRERTGYVAFISYFTLLATISSLVQQLYDYTLWREIMTWQFVYGKAHEQDAEVQYQDELFGLKLALAYLRDFATMVESTLVFFFSASLAATMYGWWSRNARVLCTVAVIGRVVPITLAAVSIGLLQLDFTHKSFIVYLVVANAQFVVSLAGSCFFLLVILAKYLQSWGSMKSWQDQRYNDESSSSYNIRPSTTKSSRGKSGYNQSSRPWSATFDRWLVVRLSIAFAALCVFEWVNIQPHITAKDRITEAAGESAPDLSTARALKTVNGYFSGVSPSLLAFLVFGTTQTFRKKIVDTFVPRCCRPRNGNSGRRQAAGRNPEVLPFSVAKDSTIVRVSFTMPTSPKRPWSPLRRPSPAATRRSGTSFGPIDESGCLWIPDDDISTLRQSTISSGIQVPPLSAHGTFLDDDSINEIAAIPLSRFNSQSHQRHWSMSSTTTTRIWSEGPPVSGSSSFRRSDSKRRQATESISKWSNA